MASILIQRHAYGDCDISGYADAIDVDAVVDYIS